MSRDILEAAKHLKDATPEELQLIAKRDWDMIRDVAAALIQSRLSPPSSSTKGEG